MVAARELAGLELALGPERGWVGTAGPPAPGTQQLLVLTRSTPAQLHRPQEMVCMDPTTLPLSPGEASVGEGTGTLSGVWGGAALRRPRRGHLGPRHSTTPLPFMPSKKKKLL